MTKTAAELTADVMVAEGLGTLGGAWPLSTAVEPATGPDNSLTTYDTGGLDRLLQDLRRPSVQVRVKSNDYQVGWQKANDIMNALGTLSNYELGSDRVVGFAPLGDVLYVGRDSSSLYLFTVNFNLTRDMSQ